MRPDLRRRLLRLAVAAALAACAGAALKAFQARAHTVHVRYEAPQGPLTVRLRNAEGGLLRRVEFAGSSERQHDVELPEGSVTAEMSVGDQSREVQGYVAPDNDVLVLTWGR